jgi:hypothetical protein
MAEEQPLINVSRRLAIEMIQNAVGSTSQAECAIALALVYVGDCIRDSSESHGGL